MSTLRAVVVVLLAASPPLLCISCSETGGGADGWQPPRIVRIEGAEAAYSMSPMYGAMFGGAVDRAAKGDEDQAQDKDTTYVLVRPGELVGVMPMGATFPYLTSDGTILKVQADENSLRLAGRVAALSLGDGKDEMWAWLRQASAADLAGVRLIQVQALAPSAEADEAAIAARRDALARLAKANPDVGVLVGSEVPLSAVLDVFDPPWVSLEGGRELTPDDHDRLASEPNLHTLTLGGDQEEGLGFLARLPQLRILVLGDWNGPSDDQPLPTLPTMPSLRRLIVFGAKMKDLAPVGDQPNLRELAIVGAEALTDVGGLGKMPGLMALSVMNCENVTDLSPLTGLKQLRWVVLPPATTQEQFEAICRQHPKLVVLQAIGCEKITNLSPAANLKRLQALCVMSTPPLDPLVKAGSLKLLGVHMSKDQAEEGREAAEQAVVAIMTANPDLAVVECGPLCLGSGYILLLVPMTVVAWGLARRRRDRQAGKR